MHRSEVALDLASALESDVRTLTFRRLRVAGLAFAAVHILFGVAVLAVGEFNLPVSEIILRRAIAIAFSLSFAAATYFKPLERHAFALSVGLTLGTALYVLEPVLRFGILGFDKPGMVLLIVCTGLLYPYTTRQTLGVTGAILAMFLGATSVRFDPKSVLDVVDATFVVLVASVLLVVSARIASHLRESEFQARWELSREREAAEQLLLNVLPESIVERLKRDQSAIAEGFRDATVLFVDIVGFTELSAKMDPRKVVEMLNEVFSRFDALTERHRLEKIKTIGDAYMVVGGAPTTRKDHAEAVADLAIDLRESATSLHTPTGEPLQLRIGLNIGPVVAGVIGTKKFSYDLWGDTVNIASRMESLAEPGTILVTERAYERLRTRFQLEPRGSLEVKGKGQMRTYVLVGPRMSLRPPPKA
jgi:class 3 adenylate cyclase